MTNPPPDLSICDREPITRLERIQGFGFLIALTEDWIIVRASANLEQFVGVAAADAIGIPASALLTKNALHDIRNRLTMLHPATGSERLYDLRLTSDGCLFDVAIHYAGDLLVIEGEPSGAETQLNAASLVRSMSGRLSSQTTIEAFHRDAARQVRAITGFDRVMIYRFDGEGVGEVIAEALRAGMTPFLGLHFPASDIPVQARALYLRNAFRIIPDVAAAAVDLLPRAAKEPLDLTLAFTRAVSPVHIEYLHNMGVGASMSISIIVAGRFWGLISCHHDAARLPGFVLRSATELFGQMYSLMLENRLREATSVTDQTARDLADQMITTIAGDSSKLSDAHWLQEVTREIIDSDGVTVCSNGRLTSSGSTPTYDQVRELARFLDAGSPNRIFHTDCLDGIGPIGIAPSDAAGMLAIPISRSPRDYILMFRRERLHQIEWGGDPAKAIVEEDGALRMSPRKSFAAFVEQVKGRANPFTKSEVRIAESVRSALIEVIVRFSEQVGSESKRTLEQQELVIAELNHRVRNILALIRGLINQTQAEGLETADYVQSLGGRVQALARAHDQITRHNWGPALLTALFGDEVTAYVPNKTERFIVRGPAIALQPQAYSTLALVVHELVTNSCKYGALSDGGDVKVDLNLEPEGDLHIAWRETGGPIVVAPTRRGFGSVIIERTVPFNLQGQAEVRYLRMGFEADFVIPREYLASSDSIPGPAPAEEVIVASQTGGEALLAGRTVLLLEDNMIVALEAEDTLFDLGAKTVWAASTLREADAIFAREPIDLAMLDINIGLDTSLELAARLSARGVPFIFASGYGDDVRFADGQAVVPIVRKPYDGEHIRRAMAMVLAAPRRVLA
ncbi:HWE histidine kinase domain-containing protein [Brevundimonas sp. SL161]|uniref:HWE histidine kinase domain-containing protein n=1 Tax=Brevundimonas sp. SL161 TaxID=2804613 RepID=UPI003CEA34DA